MKDYAPRKRACRGPGSLRIPESLLRTMLSLELTPERLAKRTLWYNERLKSWSRARRGLPVVWETPEPEWLVRKRYELAVEDARERLAVRASWGEFPLAPGNGRPKRSGMALELGASRLGGKALKSAGKVMRMSESRKLKQGLRMMMEEYLAMEDGKAASELVEQTVKMALAGHPAALKLVWDRVDGAIEKRVNVTGIVQQVISLQDAPKPAEFELREVGGPGEVLPLEVMQEPQRVLVPEGGVGGMLPPLEMLVGDDEDEEEEDE
jgi:hypothetical protein